MPTGPSFYYRKPGLVCLAAGGLIDVGRPKPSDAMDFSQPVFYVGQAKGESPFQNVLLAPNGDHLGRTHLPCELGEVGYRAGDNSDADEKMRVCC